MKVTINIRWIDGGLRALRGNKRVIVLSTGEKVNCVTDKRLGFDWHVTHFESGMLVCPDRVIQMARTEKEALEMTKECWDNLLTTQNKTFTQWLKDRNIPIDLNVNVG